MSPHLPIYAFLQFFSPWVCGRIYHIHERLVICDRIREALDYCKNIKNGLTPEQALVDKLHDIEANTFGREQAKKYPDKDVHGLLKKYWVKDETGQIAK